MELMAIFKGLERPPKHSHVILESDSESTTEMMMGMARKLEKNN
jgi:ribonuclease HI